MRSISWKLSATVLNRHISSPSTTPGGFVMVPRVWPLDPLSAAMLVVRAIDDIDQSSDEQRAALLSGLLCAAWGKQWAQNQ